MGDLDKNIYRKEEPSPYEKIIVNPIEKDRKGKEDSYKDLKNATRPQVYAALISYLKKIISSFSGKGKNQSPFGLSHFLDNVSAFRQLLVILSIEDQSHNPDFTQQLTELWHILLDDCNSLSSSSEMASELTTKIKFFISQVQNFPLGADHTLGYYFNEYAGKDWIPFPFMELLQQLHEEFNASPVISVLNNWISLLDEILELAGLKPE